MQVAWRRVLERGCRGSWDEAERRLVKERERESEGRKMIEKK